jgi:hypothetical protein
MAQSSFPNPLCRLAWDRCHKIRDSRLLQKQRKGLRIPVEYASDRMEDERFEAWVCRWSGGRPEVATFEAFQFMSGTLLIGQAVHMKRTIKLRRSAHACHPRAPHTLRHGRLAAPDRWLLFIHVILNLSASHVRLFKGS